MLALHITLYALLGTGLVFAAIELGLVAYTISTIPTTEEIPVYDGFGDIGYETIHIKTPAVLSFLVFCAVWTLLVGGAALVLPVFFHRKGQHGFNPWLAPLLIVVYFVTWVFWLAGFAYLADILGGAISDTAFGSAIVAFGVLEWLVFVALFILGFLAIFDILKGEWPGYMPMRYRNPAATTTTTGHAADTGPAPAHPIVEEPKVEGGHAVDV